MSSDKSSNEKAATPTTTSTPKLNPHAYHRNLPPHHIDPEDGIPYITKFAQHKARQIVKLARSIQLKEELYVSEKALDEADDVEMMDEDDEEEEIMEEEEEKKSDHDLPSEYNLMSLIKKCTRLQSQLATLESLKHGGISQVELCELVLHVLKLLTATVTFEQNSDGCRHATLHMENVGYIWQGPDSEEGTTYPKWPADEMEGHCRFALPSPARESLLSIVSSILSKKSSLRSVSNAALFVEGEDNERRILLILHWQSLFRMLWRTAPYLDETQTSQPPQDSNSRQSTVLRRSVHMIRHARRFFDQGVRPYGDNPDLRVDATALDLWNMVESDVLYRVHSYACYRGLILMFLFQPTRCSTKYYLDMLPKWFEGWTNTDRCHEMDFLWLVLLCRARKHVTSESYDWGPIRRRLLTHGQYWLQIPIGGGSMDGSFPRAPTPRSRSCPSRLKALVGNSSSYEEGIDFIAKVSKLLTVNIGMEPPSDGGTSQGTLDILRLLSFVTPYFNPSNIGNWTFTLGAFLHYFSYEICHRAGVSASLASMKSSHPKVYEALLKAEPSLAHAAIAPKELVLLFDALLPLCQQALYSKNGHVGRAGEAAMVYLTQVDHRIAAPFLDFATQALDISAVNLAHQAPAALSAMTRLVQPSLRRNPAILLQRLPEMLRLSLAGIDSNDQNKSIRTLIFYRNLLSWVPIGFDASRATASDTMEEDGSLTGTLRIAGDMSKCLAALTNSDEYVDALRKLPESSLLYQGNNDEGMDQDLATWMEAASSSLGDWVLGFLDRMYELLRASGEREKTSKTASGVANRHSNSDVQQTRNFSRVMKECLLQVFASMDDATHKQAVRSVTQFLSDESLPAAAKDAASLCQAVAAARLVTDDDGKEVFASPGLEALVPILCDDVEHQSNKTLVYRLRCLAGAVRTAGKAVAMHQAEIKKALSVAMESSDKHVLKTGCKLLRHLLASQSEAYPILSTSRPGGDCSLDHAEEYLGKSSQLRLDPVKWHVPAEVELLFACDLLQTHTVSRLKKSMEDKGGADRVVELRKCLRIIRYTLRGGAGLLIDAVSDEESKKAEADKKKKNLDTSFVPHEKAVRALLASTSETTRASLEIVRKQISLYTVMLLSIIASETADEEKEVTGQAGEFGARLGKDAKICKEVSELCLLLLTRRGANFRCQEGKSIWKAQKQLFGSDYCLSAESDHLVSTLERVALVGGNGWVQYKDGEDGGKTMPRRLLVSRIQLFQEALQRNASFEIPRRLRRLQQSMKLGQNKLFVSETTMEKAFQSFAQSFDNPAFRALDGYEGLIDGLFALSCHPNTQVRAAGIGVIDYALTRYGWLLRSRVPRLLAAISLDDEDMKGKFGVPSCSQLSRQKDSQGKRKRLAEVLRGVCSIMTVQRSVKEVMGSEKTRFSFIKTLCETDRVLLLMPPEDMQKMVHYFHNIFSPYRTKCYSFPRASEKNQATHDATLRYLLDILVRDDAKEEPTNGGNDGNGEKSATHWRKKLLVAWFVTNGVDRDDYNANRNDLSTAIWNLCYDLLENEVGQPLQRMAMGLFGRLVAFGRTSHNESLRSRLGDEKFSKVFSQALVFDHREDTSVGGGHDAQWSAGVEDLLRDATRNVAPRAMFPFIRTGQSSTLMKLSHAQLLDAMLRIGGREIALEATQHLLQRARELAVAPPSEDQRNQQVTSAEILAGCVKGLLQLSTAQQAEAVWSEILLPFLDEVLPKIPVSLTGAYFDAIRYGIQGSDSAKYLQLVQCIVERIESLLWQPGDKEVEQSDATEAVGTEGFTLQSKWLYVCSAMLVELDASCNTERFGATLIESAATTPYTSLDASAAWGLVRDRMLPRLLDSVGHPYESCRDHIAGCLYRIYHYFNRMTREIQALGGGAAAADLSPIGGIVDRFLSVSKSAEQLPLRQKYNSLITMRKFVSYCTYLGDAKRDFEPIILKLLPAAFEAVKSNVSEDGTTKAANSNSTASTEDVAIRTLEADVVKGYRYSIAEVSISCVLSYGKDANISRVLEVAQKAAKSDVWQVRQAATHFVRYFQGGHKFLFSDADAEKTTTLVAGLLADERREVSSAAMAALTGIVAASSEPVVTKLVDKYAVMAKKSKMKSKKKSAAASASNTAATSEEAEKAKQQKEKRRALNQQTSVYFLCAVVMANPYETPAYVPVALAAISKHSFERSAPLSVRDTVKKCCGAYKKTHMSDNWEMHRKVFTQEQLEALEDVVSTPHYYA